MRYYIHGAYVQHGRFATAFGKYVAACQVPMMGRLLSFPSQDRGAPVKSANWSVFWPARRSHWSAKPFRV